MTKQTKTSAKAQTTRVVAIPDALPQRTDTGSERWRVNSAPPIRGACSTDMKNRVMNAPDEMGYTAAAVRAHEMTHAAFSPVHGAAYLAPCFDVTAEALATAEEWRVNALAQMAGVSMDHLTDETEKSTARVIAVRKDWRGAILLTVGTWGTGAQSVVNRTLNKYAPPEWKKPLSQFRRQMKDRHNPWHIRSMAEYPITHPDGTNLTIPRGFWASVRLAQHIDAQTSEEKDPTLTREAREAKDRSEAKYQKAKKREDDEDKAARKFRELPEYSKKGSPYENVRLMTGDLDERQTGKIATKRTAANVGRKPRRLSRALTDPQRRVFDKRTRSAGGVVCVDMSGSMSLTDHDVDAILQAAGGATVVGYSNIGKHKANVWIIAHNGHRATVYPSYGCNNDCDAPALRFAASLRKDKREPFIWVSDGRAYHDGGSFSMSAAREIDEITRRERIHNAQNAEEAVRELERCARGNRSPMKPNDWVTSRLREEE